MSQLRSVLDDMATTSMASMSEAEIDAEIEEITRASQRLEVLLVERVKELSERSAFAALGYSSATNYLADRTRTTHGRARNIVSRTDMQDKAPHAYSAWTDGRISTLQAINLADVAEAVPDEYREAEPWLVEVVEPLSATDTRKALTYWRDAVDGPGEFEADKQQLRRGVSASWLHGMLRIDGWMTKHAGEAFLATLDANSPPPTESDSRTPRQRRHDALENACRQLLDNGTTATVGGEKPHIVLHADIPALQGLAGGLHETQSEQIVDVDTLRRVACDASITRIVFGPQNEVLDVGRKTRVWNTAQRKAIVARDRHCQGEGCRTKPQHCDIHHLDHWADGGVTTVESGILLCRPCHTTEHSQDRARRRRRT